MAKNIELERIVLRKLALHLKDEPSIKLMMEGDEEGTKNLIQSMGELIEDKDYKIKFLFSKVIGYGYDFTKKDEEGILAKEIYENAVKNTKESGGFPNFETLMYEGIVEDRFGWYITSI